MFKITHEPERNEAAIKHKELKTLDFEAKCFALKPENFNICGEARLGNFVPQRSVFKITHEPERNEAAIKHKELKTLDFEAK